MGYSLKNKRILITCGPTWVPIDAVRVVSNISTGALGQRIALDCARAGAKVILLEGPVAMPLAPSSGGPAPRSIRILKFCFFDELRTLLKQELRKEIHAVIHAAAVADYKLKKSVRHKLPSAKKTLRLEFVATPKLIQTIKRLQPKIFLVGFKLEPLISLQSVKKKLKDLFLKADCDVVVANQLTAQGYRGFILDRINTILGSENSRKAMSAALIRLLSGRL